MDLADTGPAEGVLGGIEYSGNGRGVRNVGLDGDRSAADALDASDESSAGPGLPT
ncbi:MULTISPECIES: hypothetical protein [Inquilinus]|uniref:Uncharacterized protein n=1 Tax=Inquilinus ginsengisoli TaxID=363840 RepID=A0ABU1JK83_9PROT|nr:hypothetical protein [Inquilinus ginsengisoli]MDR6289026.1 hypothetical protein [Inquilinus ginsengisoli]